MFLKKEVSDGVYVMKYPKQFNLVNDVEGLVDLIKKIFASQPFTNIRNGDFIFDVYFNDCYGFIFDIEYVGSDNDCFDVRLIIHVDSIFLYEIDYFDLISLDGKGHVYYYEGKFYFEPNVGDLNEDVLFKFGEYGEIVYGEDVFDIVNNGVKL